MCVRAHGCVQGWSCARVFVHVVEQKDGVHACVCVHEHGCVHQGLCTRPFGYALLLAHGWSAHIGLRNGVHTRV